jgi:hypothetical protein
MEAKEAEEEPRRRMRKKKKARVICQTEIASRARQPCYTPKLREEKEKRIRVRRKADLEAPSPPRREDVTVERREEMKRQS